ncbi:unnamed protein product [Moneuplotes crassus]|uniref:Uncharacterized protein n=1 Tax=Euplotes crassus TaxID=5936 RepID=A0AAD2DBF3_EUPCR|nr:unnamed protein product [Moneuplotes crassus]
MQIPKCGFGEECGVIAFVVKETRDNYLDSDVFVCAKCMNLRYTGERIVVVPDAEDVLECLECVDHHLAKIDHFMEWHSFNNKLLPTLETYKENNSKLKKDLSLSVTSNTWKDLPYLHSESRSLLNSLQTSPLWQEYIREFTHREFRDMKAGRNRVYSASKKWVNGQLVKLRESMRKTDYGRVVEKLRKVTERVRVCEREMEEKDEVIRKQEGEIREEMRRFEVKECDVQEMRNALKQKEDYIRTLEQRVQGITIWEGENDSLTKILRKQIEKFQQDKSHSEETINQLACKKNRLETEMRQWIEKCKKSQNHIEIQDSKIQNLKRQCDGVLSPRDFTRYNEIEQEFQQRSELKFDFNNENDVLLLKQLKLKIPPLELLQFCSLQKLKEPGALKEFLSNSIRENIRELTFSHIHSSITSSIPYIASLTKVLPLATKKVHFYNSILTKDYFQDILASSKNVQVIKFIKCIIKPDTECYFGDRLQGATFQGIDFTGTGERSNWAGEDCRRFRCIMEGLAQEESIKGREVTIGLKNCGVWREQVEGILEEYGLSMMEVGSCDRFRMLF